MPICYLALGGNVGPVRDTLDGAVAELRQVSGVSVTDVSGYYQTAAVGERAGTAYLNAACGISTERAPLDLLDVLQDIECRFGRKREQHWGPRTLDLDIVFYGSQTIALPRLMIPHPACWYRRFVLDPLAEIAADVVHPEKRVTVGELRTRLLPRPLRTALAGGTVAIKNELCHRLRDEFPAVEFSLWEADGSSSPANCDEPTFIVWLGSPARSGKRTNVKPASAAMQHPCADFESLPHVPRIDATRSTEPLEIFLRHLLQSAL